MKKILSILSSVLFIFSVMSCDNDVVTYDDMLQNEKHTIDKFIKEKNFVVLNEFPSDGIFNDNEYVLLKNGVYLHIVDYGDTKSTTLGTMVTTIAKGEFLNQKELKSFNGFDPEKDGLQWPISFQYKEDRYPPVDDYIVGVGYMSVLKYVGNNSTVKMLVPSQAGSPYQYDNAIPVFFEKVEFSYVEE